MNKVKIKVFDLQNTKLDSAIVTNNEEAKQLFKRWRLKGLF